MGKQISLIAKSALKAFILILLAAGIGFVCRCLFIFNMFEEEYLSPRAFHIFYLVFFVLIINSLILAIYRKNKRTRERFLKRDVGSDFLSNAKYIASSLDFYVELVCVTVLMMLLPSSFLFGFEATNTDARLLTLLVILPIIYALDFVARVGVQKNWYAENKRRDTDAIKQKGSSLIKDVIIVAMIYFAFAICLPWLLPIVIMLWQLLGGVMLLVWVAIALIVSTLLTFMFFAIRGIFKRRAFLQRLKRYCEDNALEISNIKKPYLSMFIAQSSSNFTIERDGKKYECKLIAGLFPGSPIVFSNNGEGLKQDTVRLFRTELLHFLTKFNFGFDSNGKKILIVVPIPRKFFVSTNQSSPRQADTGEKIGEYTIYNATGFLGALERDCL